jgi:hypothetical protein
MLRILVHYHRIHIHIGVTWGGARDGVEKAHPVLFYLNIHF